MVASPLLGRRQKGGSLGEVSAEPLDWSDDFGLWTIVASAPRHFATKGRDDFDPNSSSSSRSPEHTPPLEMKSERGRAIAMIGQVVGSWLSFAVVHLYSPRAVPVTGDCRECRRDTPPTFFSIKLSASALIGLAGQLSVIL